MVDTIRLEFDSTIQSLDALTAAIYRLSGTAVCQVERSDGLLVCTLRAHLTQSGRALISTDQLRDRFFDLVADENARERIANKTEPVRNLILSLAFASLANQPADKA